MTIDIKNVSGIITLKEKKINKMVERRVYENNSSSGKILVPKKLINKIVYVVWLDKGEKNE